MHGSDVLLYKKVQEGGENFVSHGQNLNVTVVVIFKSFTKFILFSDCTYFVSSEINLFSL